MSKFVDKPPEYTAEQITTAINLAAEGRPLRIIIDALCTSEVAFWNYKQHNPDFLIKFEQARQEGLEHLADELITIADDNLDVQRSRLKSDNYKWLLSKRKPAVYGDKIDINVNQTIDIGSALKEARSRALPQTSTDTELIDVTPPKQIVK